MKSFTKLALGGGGVKGILHIGALRELSKHQKLYFPEGVYGCSIGSVIATYLAFELPMDDKVVDLTKKYLSMDRVTPKASFQDLTNAFSAKGIFHMNAFDTAIIDMFKEVDIDIQSKKIGDAKMPLYIIASNITKGVATIFSKDVPILDAIRCSCCIPGFFKPQELYGQLYIDGGAFTPCLNVLAEGALDLSLTKQRATRITPQTIDSISPLDYMRDIYSMAVNQFLISHKTDLTVDLEYPGLTSDSDLEEFDVPDIVKTGESSMHRFLLSKGFLKEVTEDFNTRSTD